MGIIDIVEGSFPVQAAVIMPKIGPLKNMTLIVKTHGKEQMVYSLRSAVKSLETVIDHKKKPTIKLVLSDGSLIIGKADHKSIEEIKIAQALGPDAEPAVTTVRSIREKRNLKKDAIADKNSVFKHPIKAILSVVKLLLLLISIPMIFGLIAGLSGSNEPSTPVAPPVVSLTPEQIVQREKAAQAQIAEQEKAAKAQRAAGYLDQVRAYANNFLTAEEEYFKSHKASDADMDIRRYEQG